MAFDTRPNSQVIRIGGKAISVEKTDRLVALESKLKLVAAAEGKKKGDVIADALEAYLPGKCLFLELAQPAHLRHLQGT